MLPGTHLFVTHQVRPLFDSISAWSFFCVIGKFLPENIFGNFLFDSPSLIFKNLTLENHWKTITIYLREQ